MFKYTSVLWKQRASLLTKKNFPTKAQKEKTESSNKSMPFKTYFYLMPALPLPMARAHRAHTEGVGLAAGQHTNSTGAQAMPCLPSLLLPLWQVRSYTQL